MALSLFISRDKFKLLLEKNTSETKLNKKRSPPPKKFPSCCTRDINIEKIFSGPDSGPSHTVDKPMAQQMDEMARWLVLLRHCRNADEMTTKSFDDM